MTADRGCTSACIEAATRAARRGEWRNFGALRTWPQGDALVYLTAFMLTVLTDVTVAVEAGLLLSLVLYLKRVGDAADAAPAPPLLGAGGVETLQLHGALLFGSTGPLEEAGAHAAGDAHTRVLVLDCSCLIALDATGLEALEGVAHKLGHARKPLLLSGLHRQPHAALANAGLLTQLGHANVVRNHDAAMLRAHALATEHTADAAAGDGGAALAKV